MKVAGVDIGAVATKAVVFNEGEVKAHHILPTGLDLDKVAKRALKKATIDARFELKDIEYIVSTGYGRRTFSLANKTVTEITAHAEGVKSLCKEARTIIDIGGQDSKVISLSEKGMITNFMMNDKCAAGTGRFLEVMSRVLHVKVQDMGELSTRSSSPAKINSMCTVFSESEVISLLTNGRRREDIAAGLCESISKRVSGMARQVGIREKVIFTGGVAKNIGIRNALEKELKTKIIVFPEPQIVGAIGAATIAYRETY